MLRKIYMCLNGLRSFVIVTIFAFIIVLCLVQIVLRYFTPDSLKPFAWGDEVIKMSAIWVVFLAASIGVRESSHLSVDYFINRMVPEKWLRVVKRLANLIVLAVLALLIWFGWQQTMMNADSYLQNLALSRGLFTAAIPVGCAFLFLDYTLILIYGEHPFSAKALGGDAGPPPPPTEAEAAAGTLSGGEG